jgi:hypothetical protein
MKERKKDKEREKKERKQVIEITERKKGREQRL